MRHVLRSLALVTVLVLAGCSGGGGADGASDTAMSVESQDMASTGGDDSGAMAESGAALEADRQFVTSGSVSLTVEDPHTAARDAALLVERVGGHVQQRNEEGGGEDGSGSARLVVRIPAAEVTATLEQLEKLGEVQDTSLTSTEVTDQARDLDARIRALQISVARLEDLLGRAGSIADVVEAEQVLTQRQSELESLQSQRAGLADKVEMSTFEINLWTEDAVPEEPATGFLAGLVTGFTTLMVTLRGILQAIGVLLPWLVFAGLVTAVVVIVSRWIGRRKAATAPSSAPYLGGPAPTPGPGPHSGPTTSLPVTPPVTAPMATAPEAAAPPSPPEPAPQTALSTTKPSTKPRATKPRAPRTPPPSADTPPAPPAED